MNGICGGIEYVPCDRPIPCASVSNKLRAGETLNGRQRRLIDTFNLSNTWKNASLSMDTSPVGTHKGSNTRLEGTSSSESSMSTAERKT